MKLLRFIYVTQFQTSITFNLKFPRENLRHLYLIISSIKITLIMSNLISLNLTFKGQKLELNKIKFHLGYSSAALIFSQIKFPPIDITGEKQIIGDRPREREATFPFRPVYCRAQVSVSTNFCWGTSRRNSNGLSPVKRSKKKLT